jgi:hypothetical protein
VPSVCWTHRFLSHGLPRVADHAVMSSIPSISFVCATIDWDAAGAAAVVKMNSLSLRRHRLFISERHCFWSKHVEEWFEDKLFQ